MFRFRMRHIINARRVILLFVLLATLPLIFSIGGIVQAAGTVTGTVFRDYNADGTQNAGEPGVAGVTVNAFGATGLVAGPILSGPGGAYSITWASVDVTVRLEFSGLPGTSQQGAFGAGTGSGTSVQFVAGGATANYGINRPDDYCQNVANLSLVTTCFVQGDQAAAGPTDFSLVSHNYQTPGALTHPALANQIGTVWGLAYQRSTQTIFASAYAKRQAGYAPTGGPGTIWRVPPGSPGVPPTILATLPGAGATAHTAPFVQDANFFDVVGKQGLGDIDISDDGLTLFAVNLGDRQLYSVTIPAAGAGVATARGIIGNPACVNGVYRPFGLNVHDGLVYIGGVCTGESAPVGDSSGLQVFVFEFNPTTNATRQVLNFPLTYPRGCADIFGGYGAPTPPITCRTGVDGSLADWQPWRSTWPTPNATPPGTGFAPGAQNFFAYAQPMLVDIEFVNEDMVLSFRDRMGDQIGNLDTGPDGLGQAGGFPDDLTVITAGDILRASPLGAVWAIETAGANAAGAGAFGPSAGAANEQGPGNGEFYFGDNFGNAHDETMSGGLAQIPGQPELAAIVMDPTNLFTAGTLWFNNTSGARSRQFEILPPTPAFGKGGGLGDLEPLCNAAPIEIGNYVWADSNNNGIQDPNELPLPGVRVQLFDPATNTVIITATTDGQGRYIFSSNPAGTTTANYIYNLAILPSTAYHVRIDLSPAANPTLVGYTPSPPNVGAPANVVRDSNGQPVITPGFSVAPVTTGGAGQNDHTIDFGFFRPNYSLGNRVWLDNGAGGGTANNGFQDGAEAGIDGVTVNLLDNLGNPFDIDPITPGVQNSVVTAGGGYYRFDNLPAGQYIVEIPAANFTGPLAGLTSSTDAATSGNPDNDVDRDDNGVNTVAGGIRSNVVTLGPPGPAEPSGEIDLGPGDPGPTSNDRSNLTVDFGFFGDTYALGNRVWYDDNASNPGLPTSNDGLLNGGEFGFDGVTVNLYRASAPAVIVATTTTQCGGYYQFNNLTPGDYLVEIPAANFGVGAVLNGLTNSTGAGQEANPNLDGDSNDNGLDVPSGTAVRSAAVTLGTGGSEPTGDNDITACIAATAADDHTNLSVDFGFFGVPVTYSLGNRVWLDSNNSGVIDTGEAGIGSVALNLFTVTGGVPSPTPLRSTSTDANGYYLFDNLPAGDYVVEVAAGNCSGAGPLAGLSNSTGAGQEANPNADGDSNDNGLDSSGSCGVRSGIVTLGEGTGTQEPTNETDIGPGGSGVAANNRSNLTVDFGYFGTPTNPGGSGGPAPLRVDPIIGKLATPPFGLPGDTVNWTITVSNPHSVALNNVGFTDPVPGELEVILARVQGGNGTVTVNGQTVTYTIPVLNPGQSVTVTILTRVRQGVTVPFDISNTVTMNNGYAGSASSRLLSVGSLPATGETPIWRTPLLLLVGLVALLLVGRVWLPGRKAGAEQG